MNIQALGLDTPRRLIYGVGFERGWRKEAGAEGVPFSLGAELHDPTQAESKDAAAILPTKTKILRTKIPHAKFPWESPLLRGISPL